MKKILYIKIILIYVFLISKSFGIESNFFIEGEKYFKKKNFTDSKVLFEREIVFNPRSEKSYLYLAKIFYENDNDEEQEINLNNTLLINPNNDEAIYMLVLLKIKQSDYKVAKKLIDKFYLVCNSFCKKKDEIQGKFKKLNPENDKN